MPGEVGVVYGYKSGADYYIRVIDLTGPRVRSYHVVNGVRTSILNIGAPAVTPGSNYVTQFTHSRRELKYDGRWITGLLARSGQGVSIDMPATLLGA